MQTDRTNGFWTLWCMSICILSCISSGCTKSLPSSNDKEKVLDSIRLLEPVAKLGVYKATEKIVAPITVVNDSPQDVKLEHLTLSCGCMSADFKPNTLEAGQEYKFNVAISAESLGAGWQLGKIETSSPKHKELEFRLEYDIKPSTYLFPDTFVITQSWIKDKSWPLTIDFSIEALDEKFELIQPLSIELDERQARGNTLQYSVQETTCLEPEGMILVQANKGDFEGGFINDSMVIVAVGKSETMRFPIAFSGQVPFE